MQKVARQFTDSKTSNGKTVWLHVATFSYANKNDVLDITIILSPSYMIQKLVFIFFKKNPLFNYYIATILGYGKKTSCLVVDHSLFLAGV